MESTVRCPYIPCHVMHRDSLLTHLHRCKATNKHLFAHCPYNNEHVILKTLMKNHMKICENVKEFDQLQLQQLKGNNMWERVEVEKESEKNPERDLHQFYHCQSSPKSQNNFCKGYRSQDPTTKYQNKWDWQRKYRNRNKNKEKMQWGKRKQEKEDKQSRREHHEEHRFEINNNRVEREVEGMFEESSIAQFHENSRFFDNKDDYHEFLLNLNQLSITNHEQEHGKEDLLGVEILSYLEAKDQQIYEYES